MPAIRKKRRCSEGGFQKKVSNGQWRKGYRGKRDTWSPRLKHQVAGGKERLSETVALKSLNNMGKKKKTKGNRGIKRGEEVGKEASGGGVTR